MLKTKLLLGTIMTAGVLAIGAPAYAFDNVEWSWDGNVDTNVDIDLNIDDPANFSMVEVLQEKLGSTSATSNVHDVNNNQPIMTEQSGTFTFEGEAWANSSSTSLDPDVADFSETTSGNVDGIAAGQGTNPSSFGIANGPAGNNPDSEGGVTSASGAFDGADINVTGAVYDPFGDDGVGNGETDGVIFTVTVDNIQPTDNYDAATELPSLNATATALANNTSISGEGTVNVHAGQFNFDAADGSGASSGGGDAAANSYDMGSHTSPNTNLSGALGLTLLALNGDIAPASVTATSNAYNINNFAVDASATALANNMNISVQPIAATETPTDETPAMSAAFFPGHGGGNYGDNDDNDGIQPDAALIADVTQFAYADVAASSNIYNVNLNHYTNLGTLDQPVINGAATAIGNNLSIKVGAPAIND
ncbi:hypothetical protein TH25_21935 [Thalassospira profundimaris]|uniref:Uncharacterized protein n=1 Tax=Thalassospira profundimaris TaxID=502049 RepID=A0A367WPC8_9PROT|nr:hypothetical protein [Thalassospira profundimaris]RCK43326.1 hypothetical protein TH25_21935 [Thalassospira profundimaris]